MRCGPPCGPWTAWQTLSTDNLLDGSAASDGPPEGILIAREKHYKSMNDEKDFARAVVSDDAHAAVEWFSSQGECSNVAPGTPALCVAANFAHLHTLVALLEAGASPHVTYEHEPFRGWTPLHFGALNQGAEAAAIVQALLKFDQIELMVVIVH